MSELEGKAEVNLLEDATEDVDLGGGTEAEGVGKMGTLQLDDSPEATPTTQSPIPPTVTNGAAAAHKSPLEDDVSPAPPISNLRPALTPTSPPTPALAPTPTPTPAPEPSAPVLKPSTAPPVIKEKEAPESIEPFKPGLTITIAEYEKKGEGMQAYVVYKVETLVEEGVAGFTKTSYVVARRFSDFLGLHEKLVVKHTRLGRIVPPPPEKSVVGMTKTKLGGSQDESEGANEFLERRKAALQRFLRRLVHHPSLLQDPDLRDFLTLQSDLPKATSTSALSAQGMKKIFGKVGDTLSKMAFRMEETDGWFEEKTMEVEEMEESLRKLSISVEALLHFRRELVGSTEAFCKAMSMLAACEENTALSRAFSQLAETQEKVALCQSEQADKDFYLLLETLRDYLALTSTVKEVLYERVKVWNRWQTAAADLNKKRELKTRLELAGKTEKLPQAKLDVSAGEAKVAEAEEDFKRISAQIRKEMGRFDAQRVADFKASLSEYLESLSLTQQQLLKYWEAFLPEAKAIIS